MGVNIYLGMLIWTWLARRIMGRPSLPIFGLLGQKNMGFSGDTLLVPPTGGAPGACEVLLLKPMPKSLIPNIRVS